MAPKATQASLWLPGFDIDSPAYPDLFGASDEVTTAPSTFAGDAPSSETTHTATAPELPRPWRPTTIRAANQAAVVWPQWPSSALDNLEGQATKFCANLEAIAVLRVVEKDARAPTEDERAALLRFTGWGGIPASFNIDGYDASWKQRAQQLLDALQPAEYESAKASVNNSHYTEPFVIHWIWTVLRRLGFDGGRILVYEAAWALANGKPIDSLAPMAKLFAGQTFRDGTAMAQQVFGGVGFTLDYDIQLYFRRAKALQVAWLDDVTLREMVAVTVLDAPI